MRRFGELRFSSLLQRTAGKPRRHIRQPMGRVGRIDQIRIQHQVVVRACEIECPCCFRIRNVPFKS
jgi:hypothetical protein